MNTLYIGKSADLSDLSPAPSRRVSTLRSALAFIRSERFDLFIVERELDDGDGIVLAPTIRRVHPHSFSILITAPHGWATYEAAQQLGFSEVIGDQNSAAHINSLVEKLLAGRTLPASSPNKSTVGIHLLSLREREILMDLTTGATTEEIAQKRHNSIATIKSHLTSIYRKLGVRNRVEAIAQIRK
jgi:DNA-binding NarL/FixJ family response regulator